MLIRLVVNKAKQLNRNTYSALSDRYDDMSQPEPGPAESTPTGTPSGKPEPGPAESTSTGGGGILL